MRAQNVAVSTARTDAPSRNAEAADFVSNLERLAGDVKAGRLTQPQLEAKLQGQKQLSNEGTNVLWAWSGGGTPGAAGEGAALRERMTTAMKTLADAMPNAVATPLTAS